MRVGRRNKGGKAKETTNVAVEGDHAAGGQSKQRAPGEGQAADQQETDRRTYNCLVGSPLQRGQPHQRMAPWQEAEEEHKQGARAEPTYNYHTGRPLK